MWFAVLPAFLLPLTSLVQKQALLNNVVNDVLGVWPNNLVMVTYGTNVRVFGNTLTPTQVRTQPATVTWRDGTTAADPASFYTLLLVDLDAPSPAAPTQREWLHWMVLNIQGGNIAGGDARAAYVGAFPSVNTGFHRYVFQAFKQPGQLLFNGVPTIAANSALNRPSFNSRTFATTHNLQLVSANFFRAQYDATSDIVAAQFV